MLSRNVYGMLQVIDIGKAASLGLYSASHLFILLRMAYSSLNIYTAGFASNKQALVYSHQAPSLIHFVSETEQSQHSSIALNETARLILKLRCNLHAYSSNYRGLL